MIRSFVIGATLALWTVVVVAGAARGFAGFGPLLWLLVAAGCGNVLLDRALAAFRRRWQ